MSTSPGATLAAMALACAVDSELLDEDVTLPADGPRENGGRVDGTTLGLTVGRLALTRSLVARPTPKTAPATMATPTSAPPARSRRPPGAGRGGRELAVGGGA